MSINSSTILNIVINKTKINEITLYKSNSIAVCKIKCASCVFNLVWQSSDILSLLYLLVCVFSPPPTPRFFSTTTRPYVFTFLLNMFATARIECNIKKNRPPLLHFKFMCGCLFFLKRSPWPDFMNYIPWWASTFMLFSFKNSTYRETGIFFVSVRLLNIVTLFWKILNLFKIRTFKRIGINKQKHFGELPSAFL